MDEKKETIERKKERPKLELSENFTRVRNHQPEKTFATLIAEFKSKSYFRINVKM